MNIGFCNLAAVPMRAGNSHKSEMVSQLLYGELYHVLKQKDGWIKISTYHDNYEGWIQQQQYQEVTDEFRNLRLIKEKFIIVVPVLNLSGKRQGLLTMGVALTEDELPEDCTSVTSENLLKKLSSAEKIEFLRVSAYKLYGTPYLWGGRTPLGIDCSGFTQLLFSLIGIRLPRDASQQVNLGEVVDFIDEARTGDLAFFQNEEGRIVHVGMMLGNGEIIHSSGQVRVDAIDETGIFNRDAGKYTHILRVIKKINL